MVGIAVVTHRAIAVGGLEVICLQGHHNWAAVVIYRWSAAVHWLAAVERLSLATLLGDQCTFTAVARLPLEVLSSNFILRTFHACATERVRWIAIGQ